jgi:hypothetical protein
MKYCHHFTVLSFLLFMISGCSVNDADAADNHDPLSGSNPGPVLSLEGCERCIILTEQAKPAITVVDIDHQRILWEWQPDRSPYIDHPEWFSNPDEAKPVYNNEYVLITASGGGVALVRFADEKVMFHAYAGGNPHSAELFPDGNIISASSTGDHLTIFHVDTLLAPGDFYQKNIPIPFGHNVVWDKKRDVLWSAGEDTMYVYEYNFDCMEPDLVLKETIPLPGTGAHDLFPIYGKDKFWLTHDVGIYVFDAETRQTTLANSRYHDKIKSVSSGPEGFPTLIMHPKERWWSDEVIDTDGNSIFRQTGMRIYKARWLLDNPFSYPEDHSIRLCS